VEDGEELDLTTEVEEAGVVDPTTEVEEAGEGLTVKNFKNKNYNLFT
jgi:hypothetical protein